MIIPNDMISHVGKIFQGEYAIEDFLARFDVIFSTNQDMLVETRFQNLLSGNSHKKIGIIKQKL